MATRGARPPARPSSAPVTPLGVLPRRQVTGIFPALVVLAAAVVLTGVNMQASFTDAIAWVWVAAVVIVFNH